ncbi:hypothetical protein [Maricaulis salignorans]|uniref:hypothetical protein n=1 Tax=Maricaulis salignorans TaxID=144026 RepID=UPI003A901E4B
MLVLEFVDVDPFSTSTIWEGTLSVSVDSVNVSHKGVDVWDFVKSFNSSVFNAWIFGGCHDISASGQELAKISADENEFSIEFYEMPPQRLSQTELGAVVAGLSTSVSIQLNDGSTASSEQPLWYMVVPERYWRSE